MKFHFEKDFSKIALDAIDRAKKFEHLAETLNDDANALGPHAHGWVNIDPEFGIEDMFVQFSFLAKISDHLKLHHNHITAYIFNVGVNQYYVIFIPTEHGDTGFVNVLSKLVGTMSTVVCQCSSPN
jgi:hypothetical protein